MRAYLLAIGLLAGAMAGCSQDSTPKAAQTGQIDPSVADLASSQTTSLHRSEAARLPDRGELLHYDAGATAVKHGADKWYPVRLSEDHALRAIATGTLSLNTPEGQPLKIRYQRHIEHRNGNWTWIGKLDGAAPGREAVITFGEKAVFGSIPNGNGEALKLTMSAGRAWLVEADPLQAGEATAAASSDGDFLVAAGARAATGGASAPHALAAMQADGIGTADHATVDIALGYTAGLAADLGGDAQAVTRLTHLVDIANQAYVNSGVDGELRLVRTIKVDYADATSNRTALFELTGVNCTSGTGANLPDSSLNCTPVSQPAALMPLVRARETYGADVIALVRRFENPESGSCGIGWLLGAGQRAITSNDAPYAVSVISNSSAEGTCRDDTLAHEVGHNFGLQHDRESAQGTDDTNNDGNLLDPEEYGAYPYAFGYSTAADAGNFHTIMAVRRAGQTGYALFSNPNLTTCGGMSCGIADQSDNARALNLTMSIAAGFRATAVPRGIVRQDFNGDAISDVLWRNSVDGRNVIWLSANSATPQAVLQVAGDIWRLAATGDFNGDGSSDLFWRNSRDGRNVIWLSGSSARTQAVSTAPDQAWQVAGVGDFNGDGISDLLWHNGTDGRNVIWLSASAATPRAVSAVADQAWRISGTGDFNGDGMSDVFWHNQNTGANTIWLSGNSATSRAVSTVSALDWRVVATGDFNGDGIWDLLWRNSSDGRNQIWLSANSATPRSVSTVAGTAWQLANAADYNGDGTADLLWRNGTDGRNVIWLSANSTTPKAVATASDRNWTIVR